MSMAWVKAHLATGGKTIIVLVTVQARARPPHCHAIHAIGPARGVEGARVVIAYPRSCYA